MVSIETIDMKNDWKERLDYNLRAKKSIFLKYQLNLNSNFEKTFLCSSFYYEHTFKIKWKRMNFIPLFIIVKLDQERNDFNI